MTVATSRAQEVTVEVYDLLGRRVARLYGGPVSPGRPTRLTLENAGLGAGTYFIRASGRSGADIRRATIVH